MTHAVIVTNGNFPEELLEEIKHTAFSVGVDRAGLRLLRKGITPNLVVGDMDSVSASELVEIKNKAPLKLFNKEKDYTDTELAVREIIKRGFKKVILYGVLGTRFDHLLATVLLLEKYQKKINLLIKDSKNEMQLIVDREEISFHKKYRYISFISLSDFSVLTLTGFKYPLQNRTINRGDTLCISNELVAKKAKVIVHAGKVLMVRSSD